MRYALLVLLFFYCSTVLNAQVQKLATHRLIEQNRLDLIQDTLEFLQQDAVPAQNSQILSLQTRFQNNELMIDYQLGDPGENGYFVVNVSLSWNQQKMNPRLGYLLGDFGKVEPLVNGKQQIIWTNVVGQVPDAVGDLQLTLSVEWWGVLDLPYGVDCGQYPQFGFQQKLPYYAGLIGGLGSLVGGVILKGQAGNHLERHQASNLLSEQRTEYQSYTDKLQTAELVTYIGIGVIAVDAILYLLRRERHKKRLRVYEKYCAKELLSFQPIWQPATNQQAQTIGFQLKHSF